MPFSTNHLELELSVFFFFFAFVNFLLLTLSNTRTPSEELQISMIAYHYTDISLDLSKHSI